MNAGLTIVVGELLTARTSGVLDDSGSGSPSDSLLHVDWERTLACDCISRAMSNSIYTALWMNVS